MELKVEYEVEVTRSKLKVHEKRFAASRLEPAENAHLQELSLRSLKRMINQLKEEIARFESHAMHGTTGVLKSWHCGRYLADENGRLLVRGISPKGA